MPRWKKRSLRMQAREQDQLLVQSLHWPGLLQTPPPRAHSRDHSQLNLSPGTPRPTSCLCRAENGHRAEHPGESPAALPFPMRLHLQLRPRCLSQPEEGRATLRVSRDPGAEASGGSGSRPCAGSSGQTSGSPASQDVRDREWTGTPPIPVNSAKSRLIRPGACGVHGG